MTTSADHVHLNSEALKVLAHPLRARLLAALRLQGPATATDLARELATNSGATSYHLRRLADVGLVVDTGEGDHKRRVWAAGAALTVVEPSSFDGDEDAETALGWLSRDWLRHFTEKFGQWLDVQRSWPARWRDAAGMNDAMVVVTAEQLSTMQAEIDEVIVRYARVGQGNPEAKRVAVYTAAYPLDLGTRSR